MAELPVILCGHMRNMVRGFGCLDAVAATINARWGGSVTKSTLSKRLDGQLDWTLPEVIALEDALARYPVTEALAARRAEIAPARAPALVVLTGAIAKETGEAIQAILAADQSAGLENRARAVVEIDEAIEKLRSARAKLVEAGS